MYRVHFYLTTHFYPFLSSIILFLLFLIFITACFPIHQAGVKGEWSTAELSNASKWECKEIFSKGGGNLMLAFRLAPSIFPESFYRIGFLCSQAFPRTWNTGAKRNIWIPTLNCSEFEWIKCFIFFLFNLLLVQKQRNDAEWIEERGEKTVVLHFQKIKTAFMSTIHFSTFAKCVIWFLLCLCL